MYGFRRNPAFEGLQLTVHDLSDGAGEDCGGDGAFADHAIPHLHLRAREGKGPRMRPRQTTLLVPGVAPHNVPECVAVGMAFAGWLTGGVTITFAGALAQAIGMAMRNTLEGMVISPPLCDERGGASASSKRLDACGRKSRQIEGERRLSHSWVSGIVWAAVA